MPPQDELGALLDGLDERQRVAVSSPETLLAIIAGAGSGKTTVLTRRIAYRVMSATADEGHIAAVTFTRQAAAELSRRLRRAGLAQVGFVGTFHSIAYGLLRQRWRDTGRPQPKLLVSRIELLRELGGRQPGVDLQTVSGEIDWARARRIPPADYAAQARLHRRRASREIDRIGELYTEYEQAKRRRRVIDFDDLLAGCVAELHRDREWAEVVRWRMRHLFVDEFQDVNPLQFALLEAWRGGRTDLCVVGDPRQSIYGWNGADPSLLDAIEATYPGITIVRLAANHRSTPEVVDAARAPLLASGRTDDTTASRPEGPRPEVHEAANEEAEADLVARLVRDARRPQGRWRSIAVLARTHAQLKPIAEALARRSVPCRLAPERGDLLDPAARALLVDARSLRTRDQLAAWATDLSTAADEESADPVTLDVADAVRTYLREVPGEPTGPAFAEWYTLARQPDQPDDAVDLLTFHASKGREWRSVVVVGAETGLSPHTTAVTQEAQAEEARLLHVAMTRAADWMAITWASERSGRKRARSPFLTGLEASRTPVPDDAPAWPARSAAPGLDPVLDALMAWRRTAARVADVAPETVLDNAQLTRLAAAAPSTVDELRALGVLSELMVGRFGERITGVVRAALSGA